MANTTRGAKRVDVLDRARAARRAAYRERDQRDELIETAIASYMVATDDQEDLLARLRDAEQAQALAVQELLSLGESTRGISALLNITPSDVGRLRKSVAALQESAATTSGD